jgi:hypothetical protein
MKQLFISLIEYRMMKCIEVWGLDDGLLEMETWKLWAAALT